MLELLYFYLPKISSVNLDAFPGVNLGGGKLRRGKLPYLRGGAGLTIEYFLNYCLRWNLPF